MIFSQKNSNATAMYDKQKLLKITLYQVSGPGGIDLEEKAIRALITFDQVTLLIIMPSKQA